MLGLYSGLYDWKRVRRRDGEAGDGCVNRARPYHSLPVRAQPVLTYLLIHSIGKGC